METKEQDQSTEVVNAQTTLPAESKAPAANTFGLSASDIMVPIVLLMQAISKAVKDRLCYAGDLWDSLEEKVVGRPMEFIPVGFFKQIHTYEDSIKTRSEAWSHAAELDLQKQGFFQKDPVIKNGVKITKSISQNYYVIPVQDIVDGMPFPKVLRFVKTSARAGKTLSTHVMKLEGFGHKPWAKTFMLDVAEEKGDKGEYFVLNVKIGRTTTDEERGICTEWFSRLATSNVNVHEADEIDESMVPQGSAEAGKTVNADSSVNF